jgi:tRNA threonylcarbamoyl adenosine modification protein (Sua5/YciO/YrdC/YwlC family)
MTSVSNTGPDDEPAGDADQVPADESADAPDDSSDDSSDLSTDPERPLDAAGATTRPERARRIGTDTDEGREEAVSAASAAVQRGELVVLPTDTVYGLGADAFDAKAVQALLDAKGRGREMPPPVLISSVTTLDALAVSVTDYARALVDRFWPGPLTIICNQQPSLQWDLGETRGTVAIRMPHHSLAIELLERTGPMAVSSANLTGHPAATDADQAEEMLGEAVAVIIDDGPSPGGSASTIVDVRGAKGKVLRHGAISLEELNEALEGLDATIEDAE